MLSRTKKSLVGLAVLLVGFSGSAQAQDKQPDKAAIVSSFKQEIQDVLKNDNARRGVEHATVVSTVAEDPSATTHFVNKDGKPCGAVVHGRCHEVWPDGSPVKYANNDGKPCSPVWHPGTCHVVKPVKTVWFKAYTEKVVQYGFDVKVTDSLVTPYTGVLSYSEVFYSTLKHSTKEEAEQDNNFSPPYTSLHTRTFGYQDGKWVSQK